MERFRATLIPNNLERAELKKGFKNGVRYEVTVLRFFNDSSVHGFTRHWVVFADSNGAIYIHNMDQIHLVSKELILDSGANASET